MKFINDHKTAIIIGICAALIAALLIRFGIDSSRTAAVEDASLSVMTPVQRFFKNIGDNVYDLTHSLGLLKELRGRVEELTRENAEYEKAAEKVPPSSAGCFGSGFAAGPPPGVL